MDVIREGQGRLFTSPDPDVARSAFQQKPRECIDKRMTAKQAVERFIPDGTYIATGGFGAIRIATAIIHEIVRQGRKNLGFSGHTTTHDCQILSAGECFDRCDVAYIVGLEARGLSPNARRYFQSGKVEVCEWTNAGLYWRYQAAAMNVPFVPGRNILGTDTFEKSGAKVVIDPFTEKPIALFPALYPDVGIIHVHEADIYGNCRIYGTDIADYILARAAKRLIVTTERLIPTDEIRNTPQATIIPYVFVDAVVEQPYGSYPGNMPYEYFSDEEHLKEWLTVEKDPEAFRAFLDRYLFGVEDFNGYLAACGGLARMQELRSIELSIPAGPPASGQQT